MNKSLHNKEDKHFINYDDYNIHNMNRINKQTKIIDTSEIQFGNMDAEFNKLDAIQQNNLEQNMIQQNYQNEKKEESI